MWQACPLRFSFDPCSWQHSQNQKGQEKKLKVCLQEIVVKLPFLGIRHLLPVEMIVVGYKCQSIAGLSKVSGGSKLPEIPNVKI